MKKYLIILFILFSFVVFGEDEKITLDECVEIVSQHNRNYAKRQLTWFRKYEKNHSPKTIRYINNLPKNYHSLICWNED